MSISKDILRKYGIIAALKYRCLKPFAPMFYKYDLALPFKYRFVIVSSHGVGHNALIYFLANQNIHCSNRYLKSGYKRYCEDFNMIGSLPYYSILSLSEYYFEDYAKYTRLIQAKVPALVLVRDPISTLKSYLNVAQENKNLIYTGRGRQNDVLVAENLLYYLHYNPQTKERGLGKTPCLDYIDYIVSNRKNPSSFHDIFITRELLSSLPTITEKHYIDMHDISGKKTFETMQDLSQKFGFELVKNRKFFERKVYNNLYSLLPCHIDVSLENMHVKLTLTFESNHLVKNRKFFERKVYNNLYSLLPCHIDVSLENMHVKLTLTFESNHVDITSMIMPQSYQNNPKLEEIQVDVKTTKDANLVAKNLAVCQAELLRILDVFLQIPAIKQAHALSEHDVLDYLKAHPIIARDLKEILDDDLHDIKRERPDIVQTWTHYHTFEELLRLL